MFRDSLHLTAKREKGTVQDRPGDVYLNQLVLMVGLAWATRRGQKLHYRNQKPYFCEWGWSPGGATLLWVLTSPGLKLQS